MKNYYIATAILAGFIAVSCTGKKESKTEGIISVTSIFKGQVNNLDTSLYQIMKYETLEGKTDTVFLKREEVRALAADFLSLPDITKNKYEENYIEERMLDGSQNSLSIISTAKNEKLEIQKQIIIVPLDETSTGKVQSIYIDRWVQVKDSTIEQKLFWQIDKYFQVGNIIHTGDQPEKMDEGPHKSRSGNHRSNTPAHEYFIGAECRSAGPGQGRPAPVGRGQSEPGQARSLKVRARCSYHGAL